MPDTMQAPPADDVITFEALVAYGLANGANVGGNGMPWSFSLYGYPVTHENDDLYLITTPSDTLRMGREDVLVVGRDHGPYLRKSDSPYPLPCPFCAAPPSVQIHAKLSGGDDLWMVRCENDGCEIRPALTSSAGKADVIAFWNRRAPLTGESSHG